MSRIVAFLFLVVLSFPVLGKSFLIGGRIASAGEYPELAYIRFANSRCSAAVVGPHTILTAGHCVDNNGEIGPAMDIDHVQFIVNQEVYHAKCQQSPIYAQDGMNDDMALCKSDVEFKVAPGKVAKFGPKKGEEIVLSGYGCIRSGGGGGNDGILRVGLAKVTRLPSRGEHWFETVGRVALCFGDSGGPSFKKGTHEIIGVNSRGNIHDLSQFTSLALADSQDFIKAWAEENEAVICGFNSDC